MKNRIKLDAYEQKIEDNIEKLVPVTGKEKKHIEKIIETARQNVTISLSINNYELNKIKEKADRSGLPYQAFITSILHKYLNGELFDKGEVIKTFAEA
ncbi:Antitoxin [Candidatus Magnetomoraceae bacterium gMMP-15]